MDHYSEADGSLDYRYDRAKEQEVFSPALLEHLEELNSFVIDSGNVFEGSNFYWHGTEMHPGLLPTPSLAPARRNVWRAARFKREMLEVGFNAGHTALLALASNPSLRYVGVDICINPYVRSCAKYLSNVFPGRVDFFVGDSREVLPALCAQIEMVERFDLIHIDGGHTAGNCRTDIHNSLPLAQKVGAHLLLDDINAEWIYDVYVEYLMRGVLQTEDLLGDWETTLNRNVLGRICFLKPV